MKVIYILFFISLFLVLPLSFALEEVAQFEGSLDVGTDSGVVIIGPGGEQEQFCGNNIINKGEQCDTNNLNGKTCSSLLGLNYTGTLSCKSTCIYETSQCSLIQNTNGNNNGGTSGGGGGGGSTTFISTNTSKSAEAQGCVENWECGAWDLCIDSSQIRICSDKNNCGTTFLKPSLERLCENKAIFQNGEPTNLVGKLLGAVTGLGSRSTNLIVAISFLIMVLAIIIVINATKKDIPAQKVNEVITAGNNNKVINTE